MKFACILSILPAAFLHAPALLAENPVRSTTSIEDSQIVDLSHAYNEDTIYWPTSPTKFELDVLAHGETEGGYFYSANAFTSPEHGGTHLDAPIHFFRDRRTVDEIPLTQLIGPAVIIDVQQQAADDPDYLVSVADIEAFEAEHGRIPAESIVVMHSGWWRHWPNTRAYLGDDTPGDASNLHFPSFGPQAAELLVNERQVAVLGVDTASIDYGQSREFRVHRIAAERNVAGLENLTNLDRLPPTGARIIALPMKIEGGSGAPVRVIALLPN